MHTSNEKFDFLEEIVQGVPGLPAADEAKLATTKTAKRERAAPNPAVPGSLDDDDYGAPPPMKVMRAEAPGTLDEEAPAVGSLGGDEPDVPRCRAAGGGDVDRAHSVRTTITMTCEWRGKSIDLACGIRAM